MENLNKVIYVTLLSAIFCCAWSTQDKLRINIQTPIVLELKQQAEKCETETGVSAANLRKIVDKTLPKDKAHNEFFYCVTKGSGLIDKDGHFVDKVSSFQVVDGKPEDYANTIKECNKIVKENAVETLVATADCVHVNYQFAPAAQQ